MGPNTLDDADNSYYLLGQRFAPSFFSMVFCRVGVILRKSPLWTSNLIGTRNREGLVCAPLNPTSNATAYAL
jgi:hypothetical protein